MSDVSHSSRFEGRDQLIRWLNLVPCSDEHRRLIASRIDALLPPGPAATI
jgi:hypothetical protein